MAKKKKSTRLGTLLYLCVVVLGVIAVAMLFVESVVVKGSVFGLTGTTTYTGLQTVFGYANNNVTFLEFSFLNLLPYVFVLASVVLVVLKLCKVSKSDILDYVATAMLVVAGVLFFCSSSFVAFSENYANAIKLANTLRTTVTVSLGIGSIVAGVVSLISAVTLVVKKLLKK